MRLAVLLAASLACVGIGFAKSAALSAHVKDLETLQKIIQYLRGEIVTAASPLPDAFWETGRRMRDPYRDFLQDISEDMRRPDGKTLPAILEENTAVHLADTRLTKEEKEELQEAGCSLGTGDRAMQKANLDRYEARLDRRRATSCSCSAERIAGKEEALSESWNHGRPFFIFDSGLGRV